MVRHGVSSARSRAQRSGWCVLTTLLVPLAACDSNKQAPADPGVAPTSAAPSTQPSTATPIVPAPTVTRASWTPDVLEELLAPIALYPDALLGQILAASVNSQEVLDAGNWLVENPDLVGQALDDATLKAGFGPAMRALVHFRAVVDMMCQQIDWTRQVGSAFTSDQKSVLDAVQRLRAQAAVVGNLKTSRHQTVETKTEKNDQVIIEVKSTDPQIVYVPVYDPQTVYIEDDDDDDWDDVYTMGVMYSGCCYPYWGMGSIYIGHRPFYPPAYVYRPIYHPGFRPCYRYPAHHDYRHAYNRGDSVAHRDVYLDRFDGNKNMSGHTARPLPDKYAGRPDPAIQERLSQAASARDLGSGTRDLGVTAPDRGLDSMPREQRVDRGYGESTLERDLSLDAYRDLGGSRPPPERLSDLPSIADQSRNLDLSAPNIAAQRDGSMAASRDMSAAATHDRSQVPDQRDSAFHGASDPRGSFERSSSARGHASMGSRGGSRGGARRR